MGFFKSSKSHLEQLEEACGTVADDAAAALKACDDSLRGKYEYKGPEQRADLVKGALARLARARKALATATEQQAAMEGDQCPSEDLLAAQSRILAANMDVQKAEKAVNEARDNLASGVAEVEEFYGVGSREAKHLRRVLAELGL